MQAVEAPTSGGLVHNSEIWLHRYTPKPGDTVVEVGAAAGSETTGLARLVGPDGVVVAIEPHPDTFRLLWSACLGFPNVRLVEAAIAENPGLLTLTDLPFSWSNHLTTGKGVQVAALTFDEATVQLDRIDYLKMNIEGGEVEALLSAQQMLGKTLNAVVSCHDFAGVPTKEKTREILTEAGFDVCGHLDPFVIDDSFSGAVISDYLYASRP